MPLINPPRRGTVRWSPAPPPRPCPLSPSSDLSAARSSGCRSTLSPNPVTENPPAPPRSVASRSLRNSCPDCALVAAVTEAGCTHEVIITGKGRSSVALQAFTWVNTLLGNVKNAIQGTYHAVAPKHLPRYLAEFSYRFNRRFQLKAMVPRLGYAAVRTPPMPQRLLRLAEAWW
jgi:hypothetical protein